MGYEPDTNILEPQRKVADCRLRDCSDLGNSLYSVVAVFEPIACGICSHADHAVAECIRLLQ